MPFGPQTALLNFFRGGTNLRFKICVILIKFLFLWLEKLCTHVACLYNVHTYLRIRTIRCVHRKNFHTICLPSLYCLQRFILSNVSDYCLMKYRLKSSTCNIIIYSIYICLTSPFKRFHSLYPYYYNFHVSPSGEFHFSVLVMSTHSIHQPHYSMLITA